MLVLSWTFTIPSKCENCLRLTQAENGGPDIEVERYSDNGSNPGCYTNEYFSHGRCYFEVQVIKQGTWFAVGMATADYLVTGGSVLGNDNNYENYAVYATRSSTFTFGKKGPDVSDDYCTTTLDVGTRIGVLKKTKKISIQQQQQQASLVQLPVYTVEFYMNGKKESSMYSAEFEYDKNKPVRPTVALGLGTCLRILNVAPPKY